MHDVNSFMFVIGGVCALWAILISLLHGIRFGGIFVGAYAGALIARLFTGDESTVLTVFVLSFFAIMVPLMLYDLRKMRQKQDALQQDWAKRQTWIDARAQELMKQWED